jgi:hypothetical protein
MNGTDPDPQIPEEAGVQGGQDEAVGDIIAIEDRFFSSLRHLKRRIGGVWIYQPSDAKSGFGGELTLEFLVWQKGKLLGVIVLFKTSWIRLGTRPSTSPRSERLGPQPPFTPFRPG